MESIQLFSPYFRTEECLEEVRDCLDRGWTGLGFKTVAIESAWVEYTNLPNAHFLNSATAALHTALALLKTQEGWADDDAVITTPLTFVSTNHAIRYAGLRPVFADIDSSLCLDPESVSARIDGKTRAVIFVGMGGNTGQLEEIARICRDNGLRLILDAAHMAGTKLHGFDPGLLADVTCYSFQAVKNLPTGDSGMVCFKSEELDAQARKFSWLGISKDTYSRWYSGTYAWRYDVDEIGYKYHGNSVMAALALVALRYLDADNAYRRQLASVYEETLSNTRDLTLIPVADGSLPSRHLFQVRTPRRDELIAHLQANSVFPGVHYRSNTDYKIYAEWQGTCPRADEAASQLLSLPMHLRLTEGQVLRVATLTADFLDAAS